MDAELLEAAARTKAALKSAVRINRAALQLATDLIQRIEQFELDATTRTAPGGEATHDTEDETSEARICA